MKYFSYEIRDALGIHARPAGLLVKEAKKYESRITVSHNGKSTEATRLMALMGMGIKCGQTIEVQIEGPDEEEACAGIQAFFEHNL